MSLPANAGDGEGAGFQVRLPPCCSTALPRHAPPHTPPLRPFLFFRHLLTSLLHSATRSVLFSPLLIVPQTPPSNCGHPQALLTRALLHLPPLLSNCQEQTNPPKHQKNSSKKRCQANMQRSLFALLAHFPSSKDLERSKRKHKQEV